MISFNQIFVFFGRDLSAFERGFAGQRFAPDERDVSNTDDDHRNADGREIY